MAALVQSYPQQSSTVTMLQTRPSSASGILQTSSQTPSHHQYPVNPAQRNSFHGMNDGMGISTYRGHTTVAPIAPYAFTSTPSLATPGQRMQGPHLRSDQRTSSAPAVAQQTGPAHRSRYPAAASVSTTSSSSSSDLSALSQRSRDDSAVLGTTRLPSGAARPHSAIITSTTSPNLAPPMASPVKASPDRYRRPNNRRAESSTNGPSAAQATSVASAMPNVMQFYGGGPKQNTAPAPMDSFQGFNLQMPQLSNPAANFTPAVGVAADDMHVNRHISQDQAKRYRRRSIHTIDAGAYTSGGGTAISAGLLQQGSRQVSSANGRIDHQHQQQHPLRNSPNLTVRPGSSHGRNGSTESVNSTRSNSRPSSVSYTKIKTHGSEAFYPLPN